MLRIILILLIIIVVYKIYYVNYNKNIDEPFVNITNPFVDGLSQFELGSDEPDQVSFMNPDTLPSTNSNVLNRINRLANSPNINKQSRINENINLINSLKNNIYIILIDAFS